MAERMWRNHHRVIQEGDLSCLREKNIQEVHSVCKPNLPGRTAFVSKLPVTERLLQLHLLAAMIMSGLHHHASIIGISPLTFVNVTFWGLRGRMSLTAKFCS